MALSPRREQFLITLVAAACAVVGMLLAASPLMAVGLVALPLVFVLAFAFPVAHLALLVFATAIVPYAVQNSVGAGGGVGAAGLLPSDILLLVGLLRATIVFVKRPVSIREVVALVLLISFLGLAFVQFWLGVSGGAQLSQAGNEFRTLLGFGALLVALPVLGEEESRRRLLKALLAVGLLLGFWGLVQWAFQISYGDSGNLGVRAGVDLTSSGRGQLQGGLYAFPVAVILGVAALLTGEVRNAAARALVIVLVATNAICLLLTFERTFWLVTVVACGLVILRAGRAQRARALVLAPLMIIALALPLAVLSPGTVKTASERLLSLGQYGNDSSVSFRVRESQEVIEEIRLHPFMGSGLGAGVWWGRPASGVPPEVDYFAHDGYLWAAWKLGIPGAIFLFAGIFAAALSRRRPRADLLSAGVATGAQAALLALMIAAVTFPGISARPITTVMGVLLAFCALPRAPRAASAEAAFVPAGSAVA